jgi:hypothetical protein
MKTFKQFNEDAMASAGPTNVVSTGALAGSGEKGAFKKKKSDHNSTNG